MSAMLRAGAGMVETRCPDATSGKGDLGSDTTSRSSPAWDRLPFLPLVHIARFLGARDRAAFRSTCHSFLAAEEAAWSGPVLAPRTLLPSFLALPPQGLPRMADIAHWMSLGGARSEYAPRLLHFRLPPSAPTHRILLMDPGGIAAFAAAPGLSLARVEELHLCECVLSHADLAAWGLAVPALRHIHVSPDLFSVAAHPMLASGKVPAVRLFRRLRLNRKTLKKTLPLVASLLLHSALAAFPRLSSVTLCQGHAYHP